MSMFGTEEEIAARMQKLRVAQKRIEEERQEPQQPPVVGTSEIPNNRYSNIAHIGAITTDLCPVSYDFPDDSWITKPAIRLVRYNDAAIVTLGRATLPMLSSGFSTRGAAAILILAYHLKKPGVHFREEYVFEGAEALEQPTDNNYDEFSETIITCGSHQAIIPTSHLPKEAAVYSFIAASMLRLFTKSPGSYVRAWNQIRHGFKRFYGDEIDARLPMPNERAMKTLADCYDNERAKGALYRLLYMGNGSNDHAGLKRFLYEIHLSYTGLHIVNILVQLCEVTGASTEIILKIINERGLQGICLAEALRLLMSTSDVHRRRMWKYGRIFDHTFLWNIRTSSCPNLVYTFAAALKMEAPETHSGILNIVQLQDLSTEDRERAEIAAKKLLKMIKSKISPC